ncbi:MAG TPA: hypothetical protein VKU19_31990 [Bryobacteraceae bacterium]|nr:hypothetical protein [Bryobacteraceae bacterium]
MPISEGTPREFGIPRPKKARVILHERAREVEAAGTNYQERIKRPLEVQGSAKSGHALRVSSGAGFRVPAMQSLDFHPAAHRPAIIWPSRLHGGMVSRLDRPATQNVPAVRFHLPHVELPSTHVSVRATGISARGPIVYRRKLLESVDPEVRAAHEIWTNWEQAAPRPIPHAGRNGAAPQFVRLKQDRMGSEASPHLVLVPIMPEDRAFSYIPQIVVSPAGLSGVPKVSLEEQFDSGLRNWTGGVDDWLLDAAGARTGSLALFNPTLDKRDYEMEFLARIDHRSVTCAFRATSLTEYHLAKIAVADGAFTFQHGVNLGGNREWSEPAPIGVALNRKNAITVKLRAVGSEFSVSVDGQVIETWSDNRLPAGGVGFEGVPDDRARIYWVRLSPLGSPGKEYSRR